MTRPALLGRRGGGVGRGGRTTTTAAPRHYPINVLSLGLEPFTHDGPNQARHAGPPAAGLAHKCLMDMLRHGDNDADGFLFVFHTDSIQGRSYHSQ